MSVYSVPGDCLQHSVEHILKTTSLALNRVHNFVTLWPFYLIVIDRWGIVMDYSCAKFGDFIFSCFGLPCGQTES